jgi:integrase
MVAELQIDAWFRLAGKISPLILQAPKTGADPLGNWDKVHDRLVRYLERNVISKPWANHLALATAVLAAHKIDVHTINGLLISQHARWTALFPVLGLQTPADWTVDHMKQYLEGDVLTTDRKAVRIAFWRSYQNLCSHTNRWLKSLPIAEQEAYRAFLLPDLDPRELEGLISDKELKERQRQKRKAETDALVPHFMDIRAQAHLRFNKIKRLREAWFQALQAIIKHNHRFPFEFSYEEAHERLYFIVWDRRSFALAHQKLYNSSTIQKAVKGIGSYGDEVNRPFLQFVRAERLHDTAPVEGFWFEEMLRVGVIGQAGQRLLNAELSQKRQDWLKAWGYGDGDGTERSAPFRVSRAGILSWSAPDAVFMGQVQLRTQSVFIPVEAFYVAALFGLLAIELITTTGMRINELLQVCLSKEAFTRIELLAAPGKAPSVRYAFHLIPKGERTDKRHDFFIDPRSVKLLRSVAEMLQEHYALDPDKNETLPVVPFNPDHSRSHRFKEASYLFQYERQHLDDRDITACMRFLTHNMVFQTPEGEIVVLKAHSLRHGFANFAVYIGKVPIDIVGSWLHQKDLGTTWYYAETSASQIAETSDLFLAKLSGHFSLEEYITRTPEELREQAREALKRVGTLSEIIGGSCAAHSICLVNMACVGCPCNIPDPSKRHQIIHQIHWATKELEFDLQEGLVMEAEKHKDYIRKCQLMLREMDGIEQYQEDEKREIQIRFD